MRSRIDMLAGAVPAPRDNPELAISEDEIMAEFGAVMRDWRYAPFANPASPRIRRPFCMLTRGEAAQAACRATNLVRRVLAGRNS